MAAIACAIVLALAVTGCSDLRSVLPTSPTSTDAAAIVPVPVPAGRIVRTEHWTLDLTIREVYGASDCDPGIGVTRRVLLDIEFRDNDAVAMQIESVMPSNARQAHWMGWLHGRGVEASGLTFDSLPCADAGASAGGTPTLLTGYFSSDGHEFEGTEMRRDRSALGGEVVYYLDWRASR
jgi:hypothetical protein